MDTEVRENCITAKKKKRKKSQRKTSQDVRTQQSICAAFPTQLRALVLLIESCSSLFLHFLLFHHQSLKRLRGGRTAVFLHPINRHERQERNTRSQSARRGSPARSAAGPGTRRHDASPGSRALKPRNLEHASAAKMITLYENGLNTDSPPTRKDNGKLPLAISTF